MQETGVRSLGREGPLEEEMAAPSSILTWRIPCTEEPGGLQAVGSQSQIELSVYAQLMTSFRLGYTCNGPSSK